ncbi:MAG: 1-acyl-sn-glycerol-3-phosphate acyltransferase, partial [Mycoplasmoidaceae bacterium]|nr:1-acyl-sn-glycerol-3-phosphate acyltransferase [Mycoplasmoidaceae bacterium]
INLIDGVFIDRDNPRQVFDVVNDQKKLIANNYSIVLAPEGTRYFSDEIGEYKSGSLKIAFDCFIPIVQIVIYGSACRFDKDKSNKKRGPILVKISNVVKPQEFITTNVINLSAKLQESASKTYKELLERSKTKKIKGDKK